MDDSLNQFQEPKKKCKGPKQTQVKACKTKQSRKKIKGQKDIRKALQPKRNDLVAYTKNFNEVCKQSGIDVDSQQLQLAMAMSMSLQEANSVSSPNDTPNSKSMTTQECCSKIRTTLLEYGFQVPDVKINSLDGKRSRGRKRNSILFKTTDDERQQLIADKFSQILFSCNNYISKLNAIVNLSNSESYFFNICTNQRYEFLRNDSLYYVDGLFDVSDSKVTNLLRDWSDIPGRPESPANTETVSLTFTEVVYSQDELDVICSGKLTDSREVIKNKQKNINNELFSNKNNIVANLSLGVNKSCEELSFINDEDAVCNNGTEVNEDNLEANFNTNKMDKEMDLRNDKSMCDKSCNNLLECTYVRGQSPDIFDDDMSLAECINRPTNNKLKDSVIISNSDQMEYTVPSHTNLETCVGFVNIDSAENAISSLQFNQTNLPNCSANRNNDVMNLTECVINELSSISSRNQNLLTNITSTEDITSSRENYGCISTNNKIDNCMDISDNVNITSSQNLLISGEDIDLTQDCNYSGEDNVLKETNTEQKIDLTQSSSSNDITLPYVDIYNHADKDVKDAPHVIQEDSTIYLRDDNVRNDVSIFEDYNYGHSDISNKLKTSDDNSSKNSSTELANASLSQVVDTENYVDLTQPSTSPKDFYNDQTKNYNVHSIDTLEIRTFSEQGDVMSVDYDEVNFSKIEHPSTLCDKPKPSTFEDDIDDEKDNYDRHRSKESLNLRTEMGVKLEKIGSQLSLSGHSDVFVISDEELDYSMHMSKCHKSDSAVEIDDFIPHDNFDFGGISIMDEISHVRRNTNSSFRKSDIKSKPGFNRSISDSYLPAVEIKGTKVKIKSPIKHCKSQGSTPIKNANEASVSVETPKRNEYLIKTTNVTPMLDYESLSTPERNQELEKYGVKPFKRKRAIQLLQHLYNQTHPIVESIENADETKWPRKRLKLSPSLDIPTTSKVDSATNSSNDLKDVISQNTDTYEVTNVVPDIREVPCRPEDWVFQKKEKAKVHSCRVPLHIAFHNYVSCRSRVRESLLRYDPIHIDTVHAQMASDGHKYDSKELLKFMDKKCITVKTTENNVRNARTPKKKS